MDIDDMLNELNTNLERQMAEMNRQMSEMNSQLNTNNNLETQPTASQNGLLTGDFSFCPECGTRIEAGTRFCPQCGTPVDVTPQQQETDKLYGILMIDSARLAMKYGVDEEQIQTEMFEVVNSCKDYNIIWHLLNVCNYTKTLGNNPIWLDYNQVISDFIERDSSLHYGLKTHLLIVGGNDVIPIPEIEDPFGSSDNGRIPCDMCYGFSGNFFSDLWDGGNRTISECDVRNTVARLPLEEGNMKTDFKMDIIDYFKRCEDYYKSGIRCDWVMMTANASWLPASRTMSHHLPLINYAYDPEINDNGIYVAPPVAPDNEEATNAINNSQHDAGMLLFNLHGSDSKDASGFYSDSGEAFSINMLRSSAARVLNTVACYGARYYDYAREESMVLTALYKCEYLLYTGSLIPVPMTTLDVPEGVEVGEGSGSEQFMPIYCMEQYRGLPAGEALMRAKIEYFNTFRHMENDSFSLATIMMFSLYGNPMIQLNRNNEVIRRAEEMNVLPKLPQNKATNKPLRIKRQQRMMEKNGPKGLLAEIRDAVDANLRAMHESIKQSLYVQLGLEPRHLHHVDSYTISNDFGNVEKGYMYAYKDDSCVFAKRTWAEVDEFGKIKKVYKSK